ncbi:hypothetical protein BV22DRAFT_978405, partial [Leucogyrophana mollusca]
LKVTSPHPRRLSGLLIQLRTGHLPLHYHLHRIKAVDSPHCPICPGVDETIHHYFFDCPQYVREWHRLSTTLRCNALSISYMLSKADAIPALLDYINATGRFKSTFGEVK